MNDDMLDNPKAPRIRRIASLSRKKERFEQEKFLVEGPLAVGELLTHRPDLAETVFITHGAPEAVAIERLADAAQVRVQTVSDDVLGALADTVTPQGVIAVSRIEELDPASALAGAKLVAVLHEVRDPGNAGTVLRAADAAGADAVIVTGDSIDPWHPKVVRSTTGSLFHLPVLVIRSLEEALAIARGAGLTPVAADVLGRDLSPADAMLSQPLAWVFGNEAHGLSEADRQLTDEAVRLPIFGRAESLNLATAASVCLYTTAFAQRASLGQ